MVRGLRYTGAPQERGRAGDMFVEQIGLRVETALKQQPREDFELAGASAAPNEVSVVTLHILSHEHLICTLGRERQSMNQGPLVRGLEKMEILQQQRQITQLCQSSRGRPVLEIGM